MTSIEISSHSETIAAALPTLLVRDITEEVARELAESKIDSGIAFVTSEPGTLVRVQEREAGFFCDVEELFARFVPQDAVDRVRRLSFLLGPGTEQIPFAGGKFCLGQWQRIMLFDLEGQTRGAWTLSLVG